uniref:Tubulin tyrosine ligase like 6 n=1 Tax=Homo sapiens TaxID=9606 RepID=F8W896_HUMAN
MEGCLGVAELRSTTLQASPPTLGWIKR